MTWFRLEKGTLSSQKIIVEKGATHHPAPYYQYAIAAMDRDDVPATLTFHATVNGALQSCSARDLPLYLDGREVAVTKAAGALSTYPTPFVMGAYGNLPHNAMYGLAGVLDDVAVYGRSLSTNEISNYYWRVQRDLLLFRPGNGKTFGSVADDHVAVQPFTALESASIWLAEANDDELLVQIQENDVTRSNPGDSVTICWPRGQTSNTVRPHPSLCKQNRLMYCKQRSKNVAPGERNV